MNEFMLNNRSILPPDHTVGGDHRSGKPAFHMPHAMRQQPFQHGQPDGVSPAVSNDIAGLASAFMVKQNRR
jgi:hypothetical protein